MMLVLASSLFVVALLIVRFGACVFSRSPRGGWSDRLIEWFVAPGVTLLFALSFGLAFEHFLHPPVAGHGWWPLAVSALLVAGLALIWRRIPVTALPEPRLTPLRVGAVAEPADRERAA